METGRCPECERIVPLWNRLISAHRVDEGRPCRGEGRIPEGRNDY